MRTAVLAALLGAAAAVDPSVINVQIEPQQEQCFHEDVAAGSMVDASVLIFRGGKLDIKMRVESPEKTILYEHLIFSNVNDQTGGLLDTIVRKGYKFMAPSSGSYTFCLDNRMARWTAKVGTFELAVEPAVGAQNAGAAAAAAAAAAPGVATTSPPGPLASVSEENAAAALQSLKGYASRIHAGLMLIENSQMYHYHRERRHRDTIESTNGRVTLWTIIESASVVLLMTAQVVVIRTWFPDARMNALLPSGKFGV